MTSTFGAEGTFGFSLCRCGQRPPELDVLGYQVARHPGGGVRHPAEDLLRRAAFGESDEGLHCLTGPGVGHADHGCSGHLGVAVQDFFHCCWVDAYAGNVDDLTVLSH